MDLDTPAEGALVQRWSEQAKCPAWLTKAFAKFAEERKYLHTDALAEDEPNRVAINYLYRGIIAKLSLLLPENPTPKVVGIEQVEPDANDPRAQAWGQFLAFRDRVSKTAAAVLRHWATEEHLGEMSSRMVLEALAAGVVWLKTGFREDAGRDPLGRAVRHAGARDNLLRLRRLGAEFEAGDWGEDDSRHAELVALSDFAKDMARNANPMPGDPREALANLPDGVPAPSWLVPEPQVWRGAWVSIVDPENLRFDWSRVTAPEVLHLGRWWQERVWMTRDEVRERFNLSAEEAARIGNTWRDGSNRSDGSQRASEAQDPAETALDDHVRDGGREVAVWERWDLELGQVCWWVQGIPRVLAREAITATTKRGHPYLCFLPNPAAGRFLGLSDVTLARKEQEALNQALTDDYELRVASYPFYATLANYLTPQDKNKIQKRVPNALVELSRSAEDVEKALKKFPGEPYDPNLTLPAAAQSQKAIELLLGLPTEAMQGTTKATQFATQAAIMQDNMTAQMGRVAKMVVEVQRQVYEDWLDYGLACLAPSEAKKIAGPFAEWPVFDREQIARGLTVQVVAAGTRSSRRGDLEDLTTGSQVLLNLLQARQAALQQGLEMPIESAADRVAAALDLRLDSSLMKAIPPQVIQAANAQAAGAPGAQPAAPGAPGGQPAPAGAPQGAVA